MLYYICERKELYRASLNLLAVNIRWMAIPFIGLINKVYSVLSRNKRHSFHFYQECYWTMYSIVEWNSWPTQYLYKYRVVENLFSFSSVQSLSRVRFLGALWTAVAHQASRSITNSRSLLKLMSIESEMPSNHLILCCPLLLPPSVFPSIKVFSNKSALCVRWPKYWGFSFSISPSSDYSGLISFRIDWLDLLAV